MKQLNRLTPNTLQIIRCILGLLFVHALAGCGTSEAPRLPAAADPSTWSARAHGRFAGQVMIGAQEYRSDAVITTDGLIRLYIDGGSATSAQFVGKLDGGRTLGSGVVIGQACRDGDLARLCSEVASGIIRMAFDGDAVAGEIRVTTSQGEETWVLDFFSWSNYYVVPANVTYLQGNWQEALAEFAGDGFVVISIDSAGQLFFQSAETGCTGNGTVKPHLDGLFSVYDVAVRIAGCDATHRSLDGDFEGLAVDTASNPWNYDTQLRMWLSTREGTPSQAAIVTLSY